MGITSPSTVSWMTSFESIVMCAMATCGVPPRRRRPSLTAATARGRPAGGGQLRAQARNEIGYRREVRAELERECWEAPDQPGHRAQTCLAGPGKLDEGARRHRAERGRRGRGPERGSLARADRWHHHSHHRNRIRQELRPVAVKCEHSLLLLAAAEVGDGRREAGEPLERL